MESSANSLDSPVTTLHFIGHGHIDPTWMWRWTEGYAEVRATFRSALERIRESPGFRFTASSACFYQWFKESEPALYEELKQRVAEGRWEIAGGWWLEPDCNVPCGESLVRQGLHGLRFFRAEFGQHVRVGFNPDSFGHAGTLPQILRGLGQDAYVFMRPMAGVERDYPGGDTFWWKAADGSRVLTANIHESYNTIPDGETEAELAGRAARASNYPNHNPAQADVLVFFGVGDHGGGPTKAAIRWIEAQQAANTTPRHVFSTLAEYFAAIGAELPVPVVRGELQHHARGCYSLFREIKCLNRRAEHALMAAERWASVAMLEAVLPYPKDALEGAWKALLYNQFHDVLAGTSLPSSYIDARDEIGGACHAAKAITNRVLQCIARGIDTTGADNHVAAFNSLPWPVRAPIEITENIERTTRDPAYIEHMCAVLFDEAGAPVPMQAVAGERAGGRVYVAVVDLPPMGYRTFSARPVPIPVGATAGVAATANLLENAYWRLEVDATTGGIARLHDQRRGVDVLRAGGVLAVLEDPSDTWAHGVKEWRTERGRFGGAVLSVAESGEVLARVRARASFGASTAITEYTLYRDSDQIDVAIRLDWRERRAVLKWEFDTGLTGCTHVAEAAYGHAERAPGSGEEPCQQWVAVQGTGPDGAMQTFALLNDGVYSYDLPGGTLRMTLLRSPVWSHHDPVTLDAPDEAHYMDQGEHRFRFRIVASAGPWQAADLPRRAWELNQPPVTHQEPSHPGIRPMSGSFFRLDAPGVVAGVLKQSEDGAALVVRAYETAGAAAAGMAVIAGQEFPVEFGRHEIKTYRIDTSAGQARAVNLLEE